jgi:hypothetical protein
VGLSGCQWPEDLELDVGSAQREARMENPVAHGFHRVSNLGAGYFPDLEHSTQVCVERTSCTDPYTSSHASTSFQVYFVETRKDLANKLNVNVDASVSYLGMANASTSAQYARESRFTSHSRYLLLVGRHTKEVHLPANLKFRCPSSDPNACFSEKGFLTHCGSNAIGGQTIGGWAFAIIQFDAKDSQTASELQAQLNINGSGLGISAELKTHFTDTMARHAGNVSLSTNIKAEGLSSQSLKKFGELVAAFVHPSVAPETITSKLDEATNAITDEVDRKAQAYLNTLNGNGATTPR